MIQVYCTTNSNSQVIRAINGNSSCILLPRSRTLLALLKKLLLSCRCPSRHIIRSQNCSFVVRRFWLFSEMESSFAWSLKERSSDACWRSRSTTGVHCCTEHLSTSDISTASHHRQTGFNIYSTISNKISPIYYTLVDWFIFNWNSVSNQEAMGNSTWRNHHHASLQVFSGWRAVKRFVPRPKNYILISSEHYPHLFIYVCNMPFGKLQNGFHLLSTRS